MRRVVAIPCGFGNPWARVLTKLLFERSSGGLAFPPQAHLAAFVGGLERDIPPPGPRFYASPRIGKPDDKAATSGLRRPERFVVHRQLMALTEYEKYIRTEELLGLQKSTDTLTCHDEMQFQVIHQAHELYMKLIAHELVFFSELLGKAGGPGDSGATEDAEGGGNAVARALTTMHRVAMIQRLLMTSIDLLDTMSPIDYMTIRTGLGRGSGQESPGFRTMLRLPGETVWPAMAAFLERQGVELRAIYERPHQHHQLHQLCEALLDYDQLLQMWRQRHLILVYRIIGTGTPSLKGKPSDLLAHGMKQRFFPKLWDVRDELFAEWSREMEAKGKTPGYHG